MYFYEMRPFIRFARYLTLETVFPECYPRDCRLFYMYAGNCTIQADGTQYALKRGDMLFIAAGVLYQIFTGKKSDCLLAFNFDFTCAHKDLIMPVPPMKSYCLESLIESPSFSDQPDLNRVFFKQNCFTLEKLLVKAEYAYARKLLYYEMEAGALLQQAFVLAMRQENAQPCDTGSAADILSYIHLHYNQSLTNSALSKLFHFHPNYINSLIKNQTGMSLHQYILHIRITNAIHLLETTSLSINAVAQATGFDDSSYFTRCFKKTTGSLPRSFRK